MPMFCTNDADELSIDDLVHCMKRMIAVDNHYGLRIETSEKLRDCIHALRFDSGALIALSETLKSGKIPFRVKTRLGTHPLENIRDLNVFLIETAIAAHWDFGLSTRSIFPTSWISQIIHDAHYFQQEPWKPNDRIVQWCAEFPGIQDRLARSAIVNRWRVRDELDPILKSQPYPGVETMIALGRLYMEERPSTNMVAALKAAEHIFPDECHDLAEYVKTLRPSAKWSSPSLERYAKTQVTMWAVERNSTVTPT